MPGMDATALPRLLTADEVADWLGLPVRRVERMARRGELPSRRLPTGDLVFDPADLAPWAAALPTGREGVGDA
jgi:excisionase family DNA binding protein